MKRFILILAVFSLVLPLFGQEKSSPFKDQKDKVSKEGTGAQPNANDTVTVNYRGTLINGTEFDSSYKRGEPATFPVNGVIKGWTEALQLMKAGSKYQLFIPPNLAYGERAVGPDISPNSTLIFDVELMDIKPPASGASPAPSASPR